MKRVAVIAAALAVIAPGFAAGETLTLRDALDRAAGGNRALKVQAFDERIAEAGLDEARSGYLPRVDLQGGYTAQQKPQAISVNGFTAETQQADYGFFSASLTQTLWDFGRTSSRYGAARTRREALADSFRAEEKNTSLRVIAAYYAVLEAKKLLEVARDEVATMEEHLRVARNLFEQGVVTRNDLLQAQVRLAGSRQRKLAAENEIEKNWMNLDYLMGRETSYRAELEEGADDGAPESLCAGPAPVAARAEIAALRKALQGAELEVDGSRSSFYPELFGKLGADYLENDRVREQAILSATVGVRMNLFEGSATTSRLRQAVLSRARQEERLREAEAQIELEYGTACRDLAVAAQRVAVTREAILQGEENLRINSERYREQVGTATEVLDAQTLLTETKSDNYRALYDLAVARARVKKARGEL